MLVAAADEAELERVDAELRLVLQAQLERGAAVVVRAASPAWSRSCRRCCPCSSASKSANWSLGDNCGVVSLSPLDWLASATRLEAARSAAYFLSNGLPVKVLGANICPHERLGLCGMAMHAPAGLLLVVGHVLPQVLGVGAVELRERQDLLGPVGAVAEDHDPMEVVALDALRPLEAVEGGEDAGLVVALGGCDRTVPDGAIQLGQGLAGECSLWPSANSFVISTKAS